MKKHEWRTVTLEVPDYGHARCGPTLVDWLYQLENEGWEIVGVYNETYGQPTILCRKPFVAAEMRVEAR